MVLNLEKSELKLNLVLNFVHEPKKKAKNQRITFVLNVTFNQAIHRFMYVLHFSYDLILEHSFSRSKNLGENRKILLK